MTSKKKIVLVLPRGEAIRNFVLSGTAALMRKEAHITIISVVPNEEVRQILVENSDAFYELKNTRVPRIFNYFWDWLDIVHGRWLWSGAARLRWKLRDAEAQTLSKKIKRFASKTAAAPFVNRTSVELLTSLESTSYEKLYTDAYYHKLLKEIKPDLVFNGSHIHSRNARPVMHMARKLGIKTATFLFSWDNLTSQGRIIPYYDYYMVWNDHIKEDLLRIYHNIKPEHVYVSGTPQFDFHFRKEAISDKDTYLKKIGAEPGRPLLLYTTGMLNLFPEEDYIVSRLADICNAMPNRPQLVVRVYPKDLTGRFDRLKAERNDILFPKINWVVKDLMPMPDDIELYTNMLLYCDAGINAASTVSLELCMFDKPVINVAYDPPGKDIAPKSYPTIYSFDHYKPLTDSGAIAVAWQEDQMKGFIEEAIAHPENRREERKQLINRFFGQYLDGKSYIRIAEKLLEWAS